MSLVPISYQKYARDGFMSPYGPASIWIGSHPRCYIRRMKIGRAYFDGPIFLQSELILLSKLTTYLKMFRVPHDSHAGPVGRPPCGRAPFPTGRRRTTNRGVRPLFMALSIDYINGIYFEKPVI